MRDMLPILLLGVGGWLAYKYLWRENWLINSNAPLILGSPIPVSNGVPSTQWGPI